MTLNELIKRIYYFPYSDMHFRVEYSFRNQVGLTRILLFKLSTELTSKEDIIEELEAPYNNNGGLSKRFALGCNCNVEFKCYNKDSGIYDIELEEFIKQNPSNLALQWVFLNKKKIV